MWSETNKKKNNKLYFNHIILEKSEIKTKI